MALIEVHVHNHVDVDRLIRDVMDVRINTAEILKLVKMSDADRAKFVAASAALDESSKKLKDAVDSAPPTTT